MTHQVHVCFIQNQNELLGVDGRAWARMDGFSHATESGENGPPVTVRPSTRAVTEGR